jgi:signal transduction histidine kinase
MSTAAETPLIEALRKVTVFEGLTEEQLGWFVANVHELHFAAGELVVEGGTPADRMLIMLDGEVQLYRADGGGLFSIKPGSVSGLLPFSRMTVFPSPVRATVPTRLAYLHKDRFAEMFQRIPDLEPRLVGVLTDRVRDTAHRSQQREKLAALGKLSAGLAHELNNPASAVRRSVTGLRDALNTLRDANFGLCREQLTSEILQHLAHIETEVAAEMTGSPVMDALERSDREEHVSAWLAKRDVSKPWELAAPLVEAEADDECLEKMAAKFPGKTLELALRRLSATIEVEKTLRQIENSAARISDLVKAIKEYTYMDQAGEKEIDLHEGLENTLTMLHHDLKKGINVHRDYDRSIPHICARGSELNQVWTNIIDNAIDAMKGKGELRIHTARDNGFALVDIVDNGPGIPPEVRDHIFEPFYTTKPVGEGTGLGLDTVYRIVQEHRGNIHVESIPGETHFQVRLPFPKGANQQ